MASAEEVKGWNAAIEEAIHRLTHEIPVTSDGYASIEEFEEVLNSMRKP